ncbi:MAG: C1 family peptidase [Vulcanimicrobiota bacterium]
MKKTVSLTAIISIMAVILLCCGCGGGSGSSGSSGWGGGDGGGTSAVVWTTTQQNVQTAISGDSQAQWTCDQTSVTQKYSEDEAKVLCGCEPEKGSNHPSFISKGIKVPASFSWRSNNGQDWMTSIKDQGQYGTCVAFATIGVIEVMFRQTMQNPSASVDLSEWYLWYNGTGGISPSLEGWTLGGPSTQLTGKGTVQETDCPYQNLPEYNPPSQNAIYYKASQCAEVNGSDKIKEALMNGPVVGGMPVYTDFFYYKSGIYKHVTGSLAGYHAIVIVGWDDSQNCWICKNSWSEGWGESGYFKIRYGEIFDYGYLYAGVTGGTATSPVVMSCTSTVTAGQTCTINGSGFGGTRDSGQSTVSFVPQVAGGTTITATTYLSWSDTIITLITPALTTGVQYVAVVNRYTSTGTLYSSTTANSVNTTTGTAPTTAPVVTGHTPNPATAGASVTLTGTNFPATGGWLTVNGTATTTAFTSTTAVFTIPPGTSTGASVTIGGGTGGSSTAYSLVISGGVSTAPVVTACTSTITPGQTCWVLGSGFGSSRDSGQSTVSFVPQVAGGTTITATTYLSWSDAVITLITPALTTGVQYVVVVNRCTSTGTFSSSTTANSGNTTTGTAPTTAPLVTGHTPNPATAGASVTLTGTNFPTSGGYILVNGTPTTAVFTSTSAVFTIPSGTATGGATMTLGGGSGGSTNYSMLIY